MYKQLGYLLVKGLLASILLITGMLLLLFVFLSLNQLLKASIIGIGLIIVGRNLLPSLGNCRKVKRIISELKRRNNSRSRNNRRC